MIFFVIFLNLILIQGAKFCNLDANVDSFKFNCNDSSFENPNIPDDVKQNGLNYKTANLNDNTYTRVPHDQLCEFVALENLYLSRNKIESISRAFVYLTCLRHLKLVDLSHNNIEGGLSADDFDADFANGIQSIDLSYNYISFIDTDAFIDKSTLMPRFANLVFLSLRNNRLIEFDLLLPLALPSSNIYVDFSSNPIQAFSNKGKHSFRNAPFVFEYNFLNRTANIRNTLIDEFDQQTLSIYDVNSIEDVKLFMFKILNYDLSKDNGGFICSCPTWTNDLVVFYKNQKSVFDQNALIFNMKCSNGDYFVLDNNCGILDQLLGFIRYNIIKLEQENSNQLADKRNKLDEFKRNSLIPLLIEQMPTEVVQVEWLKAKVRANFGNILIPNQTFEQPRLYWEADMTKHYTLLMTDFYMSETNTTFFTEFLHWMVVNIPGNRIDLGETRAEFLPSGPPVDIGYHKYTFLVFEQTKRRQFFGIPFVSKINFNNRFEFNTKKFLSMNNLGKLHAGNFVMEHYDPSEDEYFQYFYEVLNGD